VSECTTVLVHTLSGGVSFFRHEELFLVEVRLEMMSNLWRELARKKNNRKAAVTISLILSLDLLVGLFGVPFFATQSASAEVRGSNASVAQPAATASELITCIAEPCFDPSAHSIDTPGSIWVVVNKHRPLKPKSYVPKLVTPKFPSQVSNNPYNLQLAPEAAKAAIAMFADAKAKGAGILFLQSAYRSYKYQIAIHDRDVARYGLKAGEALAARPGYSEHQTGLAADLAAIGQGCRIQVCFGTTKAGKYLATQAWRFGFIVRYPSGRTPTTGYQYEPWHVRYVGIALATEMHNQGVKVLEDFFGLPAAPSYSVPSKNAATAR
jgi:D-alanyl-D-alanine carboxypeptidase